MEYREYRVKSVGIVHGKHGPVFRTEIEVKYPSRMKKAPWLDHLSDGALLALTVAVGVAVLAAVFALLGGF